MMEGEDEQRPALKIHPESLTEDLPENLTEDLPESLTAEQSKNLTKESETSSPLPCSKSLQQRKKRTKTSICSPAPSATSVSPPSLIPTDLSLPQSCPPPAASSISQSLSQEGPSVKKKRKGCRKCSRQKIFLFDKITGERINESSTPCRHTASTNPSSSALLADLWEVSLAADHSPPQTPLPLTYNMENG
ncbi:hypothetical protein G5714_004554 [Onychostoma macrolepis]|uniref:Uncharacterized protein n=1 Tax=Onychostoma macrolepis TaxID=369639 RepID=A0A7J6D520_9TELE|nr:hypothetical protein G5714_004554 [Onychostoma macrolepis]